MIRAVVFDLDGVVRHFDPDHVRAIERRHGVPGGAIESFAFAQPQIEDVTTGRIRRAAWVEMIAQHIGNAAAAAEWGSQPSQVDPNILDLAAELRAAGIVTAILTNGTDTIPAEAAELGLVRHFDPIFNSSAIGYIKPDIRVFHYVLDQLGLDAQEVFFTDDSERKLQGARRPAACAPITSGASARSAPHLHSISSFRGEPPNPDAAARAVTVGYTPRRRSVTELPFRTLCDGGAYGAVAVAQGGGTGSAASQGLAGCVR